MADVRDVASIYGTERPSSREAKLAGLAGRQYGVVTVTQLRELGLSPSAVRGRVSAGRLHRIHRGVYAVGHQLLAARGRWTAAVLACGPGAVLSHRSAAALWGIRPTTRTGIEVMTPGRVGRRRAGIEVHDAASLRAADITQVHHIPCTTLARTLLDLAAVLDRRALERAYDQAEVLGVLDRKAVEDLLARSSCRPGLAALRAVVQAERPPSLTRSELEKRFLAICSAAALPRPQVNAWVPLNGGGIEVDFLWREQRLIVETDSHRFHGTRAAFERDRVRDQRLLLKGWRVARFTWRQVLRDPEDVAVTVRTLLTCRD
jgi:hypothetical protein